MSEYEKTDLRVSTMVITANWGTQINLDKLFGLLPTILIPIWYPGEGILKFENKNMVLGASYKDVFTNRTITKKSFFNQSTMVLRRIIDKSETDKTDKKDNWKEVNVKLFANGGIQMTGITSIDFAKRTADWLLDEFQKLSESPFVGPASIQKFSVQLINTDYSINKFINQDALHKIFINDYNLFSMLEKTIYQGLNTKYFYNTTNNTGVCNCSKSCKGQGMGDGDGECKRITMSIFRTGKIIITGARDMGQIRSAYTFLNSILNKYSKIVLYNQS